MIMRSALALLLLATYSSPALSFLSPPATWAGLRQGGRGGCAPCLLSLACECQPSRREVLAPAIAWLAAQGISRPANAYDFSTIKEGGFSYLVPEVWKESGTSEDGKVFSDPILGPTLQGIKISKVSAGAATNIKELGKLEKINLSKQLGLKSTLNKADMISAASRTSGANTFYDFDLALAPKTCSRDKEMLVGTCPYDTVVLLSACVKGGEVVVLQVTADAKQWKASGPALKSLRNSFTGGL